MAEKFYGKVGYAETIENPIGSGVWVNSITERYYYGDVLKNRSAWAQVDQKNDNLTVSVNISIVADAYALNHFSAIKYIEWMGVLWKVVRIEPQRPRLILELGGEYNG